MNRVKKLYSNEGTRSAPIENAGRNAFTLVEVMVAASVMVLAICSSIIVLQQGLRAIDTARYTTLAGQILQSQMEKLRLLTWTQLTNTTTGPSAPAFATFTPDISASATSQINRFFVGSDVGKCSQTIVAPTTGLAAFDNTMRVITLTATWKGIDDRTHSLSYTTYYARYGLSDFFYSSH
jgi:Tfp pilus assembly protein PilV